MNTAFLSLGSNLGNREAFLHQIIDIIEKHKIDILARSTIIETDPWGVKEVQEKYLNQVIKIRTSLYPFGLLNLLQEIEIQLGRTHKGQLQPRNADIDIIFFNDWSITSDRLCIPHLKFRERLFVLAPLNEIEPEFIDPVSQQSIKSIYHQCQLMAAQSKAL